MTGALKAKVGGNWVPITYTASNEVQVSPDQPTESSVELWYDSDEDDNAVDAANYWNSAWGIVAEARWASSWSSASGTAQTITATSGTNTFTAWLSASRRYRLYWQGMVTSTVAADYVVLQHQVNGAALGENNAQYIAAANAQYFTWVESRYIPPADGNYTFVMTGRRSTASTGTVSVINTGNNPLWLMVEDLGPIARVGVSPPAGQPVVTAAGNALGVIAVAGMVGHSGAAIAANTVTPVSNPVSAFLQSGRRYRLSGSIRASSAASNAAYLRVTGPSWLPSHDTWVVQSGNYDQINLSILVDGTGATETFTLNYASQAASNLWDEQITSYFYIEDVGPNTSPALPITAQPAPWIPVATFQNGWTNYGSGWYVAQYRKVGDEVQLRGLIKGGTNATVGFYLPPGFRPVSSAQHFATPSVDTLAVIRVAVDGGVQMGNPSQSGWLDLSGVRFSVTPGPTA
jgi:hypothetical protein